MFTRKTLLITGGTGSFGNAVMRRFLKSDIGEIRVLSRDEKKQDDMRKKYADPKLKFYIGDVRDLSSVRAAMAGVDYVFNAAALKQVPSCEFFPMEAVRTNVMGTDNVIEAAMSADATRSPREPGALSRCHSITSTPCRSRRWVTRLLPTKPRLPVTRARISPPARGCARPRCHA